MASLNDVMLALGRLQEGVEQLRDDFSEEKGNAHESRTAIHRRLDDQAADIHRLDTTISVSGEIHAQTRNSVQELTRKVEENHAAVAPSVEDWRRMKAIGLGVVGLLALGGLSIASIVYWAGEAFWAWVRHRLGLF